MASCDTVFTEVKMLPRIGAYFRMTGVRQEEVEIFWEMRLNCSISFHIFHINATSKKSELRHSHHEKKSDTSHMVKKEERKGGGGIYLRCEGAFVYLTPKASRSG